MNSSNRDPFRPQRMRLTELPVGASGRVCELSGEANVCARLREMGFCESAVIAKVSGEKTLLCQLCNTRIALSDRAAQHIVVELIRGGV
jgi:ferrous iron transport protein A